MSKLEKTVQVAFFKGEGSLLSKGIQVVTNSKYSHTEMIVGKYWYGANVDLLNKSMVTKREKPKVEIDEWDIFDIKVTKDQYKNIVDDLNKYVGTGYNFSGIIKYLIGYNISGNDKFFCSEFVTYVLMKNKILSMHNVPISYDPGALYREINNKFIFTRDEYNKVFKGKLNKLSFSNEEIYMAW